MTTVCGICEKELKMINNAHLNSHGLTSGEYDKKFPLSQNARYPRAVRKGMGKTVSANHSLFDKFTNKNTWLLGLITADGSVCGKSHPNKIQFYNTDKGLIDEFQRQTNSQVKISERQGIKGQLGKKIVYQISVNSLDIVDRLKSLNAYGTKDKRNPFNHIPNEFKWSFIKGLFDGDGNFYKGHFSIAGREELISDVYNWICKQLNKEPNKIYHSTGTDKTVYFQINNSETKTIYYFMEKHAEGTFNSKKYKKMQNYIEISDVM